MYTHNAHCSPPTPLSTTPLSTTPLSTHTSLHPHHSPLPSSLTHTTPPHQQGLITALSNMFGDWFMAHTADLLSHASSVAGGVLQRPLVHAGGSQAELYVMDYAATLMPLTTGWQVCVGRGGGVINMWVIGMWCENSSDYLCPSHLATHTQIPQQTIQIIQTIQHTINTHKHHKQSTRKNAHKPTNKHR